MCVCVCVCVCVYHHQVVLLAWISLILTIRFYHPSFPAGPLDYIPSPYRAVVDKFLLVSQDLHVSVKESIRERHLWVSPYFSSNVPHVRLTWIVFEVGDSRLYSCCFVGCCFQDLFNMTRSILGQFPSSFFCIHLVSVYVVHPYSRIDTTAAWKN